MDLRLVCIVIVWIIGIAISIGIEKSLVQHKIMNDYNAAAVVFWPIALLVLLGVGNEIALSKVAEMITNFILDTIDKKHKGDKND